MLFLDYVQHVRGVTPFPYQRVAMMAAHPDQYPDPTPEELAIFHDIAGGRPWPRTVPREVYALLGVRSFKDFWASFEANYRLTEFDPWPYMTVGQTYVVALTAPTLRHTEVARDYIVTPLKQLDLLADVLEEGKGSESQERIICADGKQVLRLPGTASAIRGLTCDLIIVDEAGYLPREGKNSDWELHAAALTRGAGFPTPQIFFIGTPSTPDGIMYERHAEYFGKDSDDVLYLKCSTAKMNPSPLVLEEVERARRLLRPEIFRREYEAEFCESVTGFLPAAAVDAAATGAERQPQKGVAYYMGCDFSGRAVEGAQGRRLDSTAASVAHVEGGRVVQDLLRVWTSADIRRMGGTGELTQEVVRIADRYRVTRIRADRYSGDWNRDRLAEASGYRVAIADPVFRDTDGRLKYASKSERYASIEQPLTAGGVTLLDDETLKGQLKRLERRWKGTSREADIDHPRNQHDDAADATATSVLAALTDHYARKRAASDDSEATRPVNPDDYVSVYDADINELMQWARENRAVTEDAVEAWQDGALTHDQASRLRVDLVEARCRRDGNWAMRWRLERGGIGDPEER